METEVTLVLGYFPFGQMRKLTRQKKQGCSLELHNPKSPRSKGRVDAKGAGQDIR